MSYGHRKGKDEAIARESVLVARGFDVKELNELVRLGFAAANAESVIGSAQPLEVARLRSRMTALRADKVVKKCPKQATVVLSVVPPKTERHGRHNSNGMMAGSIASCVLSAKRTRRRGSIYLKKMARHHGHRYEPTPEAPCSPQV
jgi:hypothetical protein